MKASFSGSHIDQAYVFGGTSGNDGILGYGGGGGDSIDGGSSQDDFPYASAGSDTFGFDGNTDSGTTGSVGDFSNDAGDKFLFDMPGGTGTFIGGSAFNSVTGEVPFLRSLSDTLEVDANGGGIADFIISAPGIAGDGLTNGDFMFRY
ncbi:MAG: hypothetical protein AAFY02_12095 [Pseudomonadota bacterium]